MRNVDPKICSPRFDYCPQAAPHRLLQQYLPGADITAVAVVAGGLHE
jgi:hypothetical protein